MNVISTNPAIFFDVAALVAGILMVVTGMTQKRLNWRSAECPTCHHPEELVFLPLALECRPPRSVVPHVEVAAPR